jgi:hypothetical protein
MKKSFFCIFFLFVFFAGFSQTLMNETLTVLPKDVYIGDIIEIRYSFTTNINLTDNLTVDIQLPENPDYDILSMKLIGNDGSYQFVISCIPWKVGSLDLPKIDLSEYSQSLTTSFAIDIPSITVQSIVKKTGTNEIRPVASPLLIPGTTWLIYIFIFLIIIFLSLTIYLLIHTKKVISFWNNYIQNRISKKNLKKTVKQIKKLNKKSAKYDDSNFAKQLSIITRQFLSTRFKHNFNSVVSSKIWYEINNIFQDTLPDFIEDKVFVVSSVLERCDYIRFSGGKEEDSSFSFVERSSLSENLIEAFTVLANQRSL